MASDELMPNVTKVVKLSFEIWGYVYANVGRGALIFQQTELTMRV